MQFLRESNLNIIGQKKNCLYFFRCTYSYRNYIFNHSWWSKVWYRFYRRNIRTTKIFKANFYSDLRNSLAGLGYGKSEIKRIGLPEDNEVLIRMELVEEGADVAQKIEDKLRVDFPNNSYDIRSVTEIGPTIGGELRRAAMMAILISLLGILVYISWRFEFKFAVGAVVALFHDVLITLDFSHC